MTVITVTSKKNIQHSAKPSKPSNSPSIRSSQRVHDHLPLLRSDPNGGRVWVRDCDITGDSARERDLSSSVQSLQHRSQRLHVVG